METVLFIAYYFPPIGGAGVQRSQKFVQYLPAEGFLPVVVTGPRVSDDRWTPQDSTLLAGLSPDVSVHRTDGPVPGPAGKLRRRLESALALRSAFSQWWVRSATEVTCRVAGNARLIFATMSPFESAEVASEASRRLGIPWVADLRDPWALDEMMVYPTLLHRRMELDRMARLLSTAALIVMNTPEAIAAVRAELPPLRHKNIVCITNGFDREDFLEPLEPKSDRRFRIVHTGYLHTDMGLQLRRRRYYRLLGGVQSGVDIFTRSHAVLLEAVERWCAERPEVREDLELVFAGKTSGGDQALAERSGVSRQIRFTGYLSHPDSLRLIRSAELLFLPMHNLPSGRRSRIVPGKTYEYIASARPIMAAVPDGDARDFLSQSGTSFICRPADTAAMIQILDRVYTGWKSGQTLVNPNKAFAAEFERRSLTRALAKNFQMVLAKEETVIQLSPPSKPNAHLRFGEGGSQAASSECEQSLYRSKSASAK
jgi:glycosyltransferase involved in cell wall biosynthesis